MTRRPVTMRCGVKLSTDIGDSDFRREGDAVCLAARECLANSVTWGGTDAYMFHYHHRESGEHFLVYACNNTPFANADEIVNLGLTPNMSGNEGHSLQGCGLVHSAGILRKLTSGMKLIIASRCDDGDFAAYAGHCDGDSNNWVAEDVSDEWVSRLTSILGDIIESNDFRVFYIFQADPDKKSNGNPKCLMSEKIMANLAFLAPGFLRKRGESSEDGGVALKYGRTIVVAGEHQLVLDETGDDSDIDLLDELANEFLDEEEA